MNALARPHPHRGRASTFPPPPSRALEDCPCYRQRCEGTTTVTAKTPAELSSQAADSVRAINHATLHRPNLGWEHPGDAYSTVAGLAEVAGYLPQAIGQIESLIGSLEDGGNLRSDLGPADLPDRLIGFHGAIADAIAQAHGLRRALDQAHQALGLIAYQESQDARPGNGDTSAG